MTKTNSLLLTSQLKKSGTTSPTPTTTEVGTRMALKLRYSEWICSMLSGQFGMERARPTTVIRQALTSAHLM